MHAGCYAMNPIGPQTVPHEWVARLASLVHAIRHDWDEAGIRAALQKVIDRPLVDVTAAALAACRRSDQRTPAIIALDGAHWTAPGAPPRTTGGVIVTYCEHGEPGSGCLDCHPRTHSGVTMSDTQRATIRAQIAEGRAHLEATRLDRKDPSTTTTTEEDQ